MDYWDIVKPTYIENWEQPLHSLSIASIDIPLLGDAARRLGTNIVEYGDAFCETDDELEQNRLAAKWHNMAIAAKMTHQQEPPDKVDFVKQVVVCSDISDIRVQVSEAVAKMPSGAFVRLGSRSPKDSYLMHQQGGKILPGEDPLRFLTDCSERVYEDLMLAIQKKYISHIWVRQWTDIPHWSEFRCFMHHRKLVGISQYYYDEIFPEIDADLCEWAIKVFFDSFLSSTTLDSVVFDVFVKVRVAPQRSSAAKNTRFIEVKLLEINPFFELTDPCLFSWHAPFDGSFRHNRTS